MLFHEVLMFISGKKLTWSLCLFDVVFWWCFFLWLSLWSPFRVDIRTEQNLGFENLQVYLEFFQKKCVYQKKSFKVRETSGRVSSTFLNWLSNKTRRWQSNVGARWIMGLLLSSSGNPYEPLFYHIPWKGQKEVK